MLFHDANDFVLGQIIWCDHGDPDIDASSRGHYLDAATSTGGKIRPCLIVGIDVKSKNLTLAPISSFRDGRTHWHPGWEPLAHDKFPIYLHSDSNSIWLGRPAVTRMRLADPEMHTERPEFSAWSCPPTSLTNYDHYWKRREIYAMRYGTNDPFILKTFGELQPKPKARSGPGRERSRGIQSAKRGISQGPTAQPPQSAYNQLPAMSRDREDFIGNPPLNGLTPNYNIRAPPNHHGQRRGCAHAQPPTQVGGDPAPRAPPGGYDAGFLPVQLVHRPNVQQRRQTGPPMNWKSRITPMNQLQPMQQPWRPEAYNARDIVAAFASLGIKVLQQQPQGATAKHPQTPYSGNFGGNGADAPQNANCPPTACNGPVGFGGNTSTGPLTGPTPRRRRRGKHK
ncbi:hypothetical protein B0H15DRAFT_1026990 [Mycena belliarum]|uniref:Uncharacterized protein n=1 Tax=Mycena belliarum TaxID=1033014 RepID=A0AAD6TRH3_9AGAR|nr:hypothetical protein B0H15DRAFT_1026990 [Mycena belliae]